MTREEMTALLDEANHPRHGCAGYGLRVWMASGTYIEAPSTWWDRESGVLWLGDSGRDEKCVVALAHIEAAIIDWSPGGTLRFIAS